MLRKQRYHLEIKDLVKIGIIAAIYVVLTVFFAPISFHVVQVRISESLTVLPFITGHAIPGLTIGVFIANTFFGGLGLVDIVFGTLATLIAAYLTRKMPSPFLAPIPPVLVNALIVGGYLSVLFDWPLVLGILQVGAGQLLACYLIGLPLLFGFKRLQNHIDF